MNTSNIIEQIQLYIKNRILDGSFRVDEKISEREICEQFDVSRTIVRQALFSLKDSGWLYTKSKSGTYIAEPNRAEIIENYMARIVVEPKVLEMAYPNLTSNDIQEMHDLLEAIQSNPEGYYLYETNLHLVYIRKANNRYIVQFFESMLENMMRLATLSSKVAERMPKSVREWSDIVDCLEKHNPQEASLRLTRHLLNSYENYLNNNP